MSASGGIAMSTPQNFRSAFHGFNRDDVVNYISFLTTKHENELNQLHTEMEQMQQELSDRQDVDLVSEMEMADLRDQLEQSQPQIQEKDEAIAQLRAQLQEKDETIAQLRDQLQEKDAAIAELRAQIQEKDAVITQLQAQQPADSAESPAVPALKQPGSANPYEWELSAYRRAERAERRAIERVGQMYAKAGSVLEETVTRLEQNTVAVDKMAEQIRDDLALLESAVAQTKNILTDSAAMVAQIDPEE